MDSATPIHENNSISLTPNLPLAQIDSELTFPEGEYSSYLDLFKDKIRKQKSCEFFQGKSIDKNIHLLKELSFEGKGFESISTKVLFYLNECANIKKLSISDAVVDFSTLLGSSNLTVEKLILKNIQIENAFESCAEFIETREVKDITLNLDGSTAYELVQILSSRAQDNSRNSVQFLQISHESYKTNNPPDILFSFYYLLINLQSFPILKSLRILDCKNLSGGDLSSLHSCNLESLELYDALEIRNSDLSFLQNSPIQNFKIVNNSHIRSLRNIGRDESYYESFHCENLSALKYLPSGVNNLTVINCPEISIYIDPPLKSLKTDNKDLFERLKIKAQTWSFNSIYQIYTLLF